MSGQGWRHFPYARTRFVVEDDVPLVKIDVHDGDTLSVIVDQGFGGSQEVAVRLYGVSCPETRGTEKPWGMDARAWLSQFIWGYPSCSLWTWRMSFTRYVGRLFFGDRDLSKEILISGYGLAWDVRNPRPVFSSWPNRRIQEQVDSYDIMVQRDCPEVS